MLHTASVGPESARRRLLHPKVGTSAHPTWYGNGAVLVSNSYEVNCVVGGCLFSFPPFFPSIISGSKLVGFRPLILLICSRLTNRHRLINCSSVVFYSRCSSTRNALPYPRPPSPPTARTPRTFLVLFREPMCTTSSSDPTWS